MKVPAHSFLEPPLECNREQMLLKNQDCLSNDLSNHPGSYRNVNAEGKIPDISNVATNTTLDAKINEVNNTTAVIAKINEVTFIFLMVQNKEYFKIASYLCQLKDTLNILVALLRWKSNGLSEENVENIRQQFCTNLS